MCRFSRRESFIAGAESGAPDDRESHPVGILGDHDYAKPPVPSGHKHFLCRTIKMFLA